MIIKSKIGINILNTLKNELAIHEKSKLITYFIRNGLTESSFYIG